MAKGSHATLGDYPRVCIFGERCLCGGKIKVTGDEALWFHTDCETNLTWSAHIRCFRAFGFPQA